MRNCFVPGCDQQQRLTPKRAMFLVPKNKELLEKWIEALPKIRALKWHDKVCHLHFTQEDIISSYDHTINGQLYQLERERPRLRPNAVPKFNLPTVKELESLVKSSRKNGTTTKASKHRVPSVVKENFDIRPQQFPDYKVVEEKVDEKEEEISLESTTQESGEEMQPPVAKAEYIFSLFYNNIHTINLPNTLWAVHLCPARTALFFTYMDAEHLQCTKVIRITSGGTLRVVVANRLLYELNVVDGVRTVEHLAEILRQTDKEQIHQVETLAAPSALQSNEYNFFYIGGDTEDHTNITMLGI